MTRLFIALPLALLAACSPDASAPPEDGATPDPAAAPADTAGGGTEEYRYSQLEGCELIRSAPEEAGFSEHECEGPGGYRLRLVEADLRENIVLLAPGGGEHGLGLPALANGAFSSLGDTVEWRGEVAGGEFAPHSLILRQSVMEDPDPAVPEASYLLAVRLAGTPCVVARIPAGSDQNERARAAADAGGECLPAPGV